MKQKQKVLFLLSHVKLVLMQFYLISMGFITMMIATQGTKKFH